MLLAKYSKIEELRLEAYYLKKISSEIPIQILIELECKHKKSKLRREIHEKVLSQYTSKILTINELVSFNSDLIQLVHRFNLIKTKFHKQILNGVYFELLTESIKRKDKCLSPSTRAYYGKNYFFKLFPRFG